MAGFSGEFWAKLFEGCSSISQQEISLHSWPDGECLMEQEEFVVEALGVIKNELLKIMKEQIKRG